MCLSFGELKETTNWKSWEETGLFGFPLSPNQIISILTPRRAWTENLLTLYCACLILTQLSTNVYQVLSDGDE